MPEPLKVLIVTRGLPMHQLGGMEAATWDLSREFARIGLDVAILTTASPNLSARSTLDEVAIDCLPVPSGRYSKAWWAASSAAYAERYEKHVDLVFSVSAGAWSIARHRSRGRRPVFIAQAHGTSWGEILSRWRQRRPAPILKSYRNFISLVRDTQFRRFDAIVGVGATVDKDLRQVPTSWVIGDLPVERIDNGIDAAMFAFDQADRVRVRAMLGIPDDHNVIIFAARLQREKGVQIAIDAFALALRSDPTLRLIIAGAGTEEAVFRERAKNLGDRCLFVGSVPRGDLPAYLSAADLFLFPTLRQEGLPLNLLEALASGLPVVAAARLRDPRYHMVGIENDGDVAAYARAITDGRPDPHRTSLLPEELTLAFSAHRYHELFKRMVGRQVDRSQGGIR